MIKSKVILIIEDEFFILDMYRMLFMKNGYEVITAGTGVEGFEKAQANKVDLILLDILLPKMDGIEVLKQLKNDPKTKPIPVFMLTNLGQEGLIAETLKLGAKDYLIKVNFSPKEILAKVQDFFRSK